ncbi:MAG: helix-turn-helix transcriptional regulator [Clostridia bacterium]|nr:helix-turn-helix transcriptional regulator [Clostridia bacterium]
MEITCILQGGCEVLVEDTGEQISIPGNSVVCTLFEHPRHQFCHTYHEHITVRLTADYSHVTEGGLVLPRVLALGKEENPILPLMEQLVMQYTVDSQAPQNIAMLWELLGKLSQLYLAGQQREQNMGQMWYVKKAQRFIAENIAMPLRVTDVAAHLHISPGYLSHLFNESMGQTVVEYINSVRVERIEELVLKAGMDVRQAGMQVGMNDPNYVSRLFRKVKGYSISEVRKTILRKPDLPE